MTSDPLQQPAVQSAINQYLAGTIGATEMEIEIDLLLRPRALSRLVEQGVYPREDVRRIVIDGALKRNPYLSLNQFRALMQDDGSVIVLGARI